MSIQTLKQKTMAIHSRTNTKNNKLVSVPCSNSCFKMAGVSCSSNVKRNLRQQPIIIKSVDCGNSLSDNHSQSAYIEMIKDLNVCDLTTEKEAKPVTNYCNIKGKDPITYAEYISSRRCKDPRLHPLRMKVRIGKLTCGNKVCC